jgi:CHAD domain-containing protein
VREDTDVEIPGDSEEPITTFAPGAIRKRRRKFRKQARLLSPDSPADDFHAVRVLAKKYRYTVEFMKPLYGEPAAGLASTVASLQDVLGEHQDCKVAIDWLGDLATEAGRDLPATTLLYMGELRERNRVRMSELRGEWPGAYRKVKSKWARLRTALKASDLTDAGVVIDAGTEPVGRLGPMLLLRRLIP